MRSPNAHGYQKKMGLGALYTVSSCGDLYAVHSCGERCQNMILKMTYFRSLLFEDDLRSELHISYRDCLKYATLSSGSLAVITHKKLLHV